MDKLQYICFWWGKKTKQRNVELAPSNGSTWSHGGNNNNWSKRLFEGWMLKVLCSCLNFLSFTIRDSLHTKLRCDNIAGITAIKSDYETLPCCPRNKCSSSVLHKICLFVFFIFYFFQWKSFGTILHWRIMICKCSTLNINQQNHARRHDSRFCLDVFLMLFVTN